MTVNGNLIKQLRLEKGWSMRELAQESGVAKSQISDLENGQLQNTTIDTICKIANVLEVNPANLFSC